MAVEAVAQVLDHPLSDYGGEVGLAYPHQGADDRHRHHHADEECERAEQVVRQAGCGFDGQTPAGCARHRRDEDLVEDDLLHQRVDHAQQCRDQNQAGGGGNAPPVRPEQRQHASDIGAAEGLFPFAELDSRARPEPVWPASSHCA